MHNQVKPTPHPHAENMRLYAEDAASCEKPWEKWEFRAEMPSAAWVNLRHHPRWELYGSYRRKRVPRVVWVNEYTDGQFGGVQESYEDAAAANDNRAVVRKFVEVLDEN